MAYVRNQKNYMMIFPLILLFVFLAVIGGSTFNTKLQDRLLLLDRGWNMSYLGTTRSDVKLTDSNFGQSKKNQSVILSKSLPYIKLNSACVTFRTVLSSVDVYVAGKLVYTYGHDYERAGKMIPKHMNYVALPKHYAGSMLQIVVTPGVDDAFSGLSEVYFGSRRDMGYFQIQRHRLPLVVGSALAIFGLCLVLLMPVLFLYGEQDFLVMQYAFLAIVFGTYILCYNDVINYYLADEHLTTILEYVTLYLIAPVVMFFVRTDLQEKGVVDDIFVALGLVNIAFFMAAVLSHAMGIVCLDAFVTPYHFFVLPQSFFVLWAIIRNIITRTRRSKTVATVYGSSAINVLLAGTIIFVFCTIVDIMRFNYMKYLSGRGEVYSSISFITIGAMIFVTCLLCNYFFHCIDHINEASIRGKLEGMAYEDVLTGLSNRARCEHLMDKADQSGRPYAIISLDMDGLKATNDKYGHVYGDALLKGFADILRKSFPGAALIGRMGGDEFLILLTEEKLGMAPLYIKAMEHNMKEQSKIDEKLKFSASWGMCQSREKVGSAHQVYMEADSRMYKMKEEHHRAGGDHHE